MVKWFHAVGIGFLLVWDFLRQGLRFVFPREDDVISEPKPELNPHRKEIDCSGCEGKGKIYYGPDHPVIQISKEKPGYYTCPYCGGSGKLDLEVP